MDIESILADLNPPQREAVTHESGPLLILAGAGSGKTRVLTRRIAYLIASGIAAPWQILAVTFTNKAAAEMARRVQSLVGEASSRVRMGTFHSVCLIILKVESENADLPKDFLVYDGADQLSLIKGICRKLWGKEPPISPRAFIERISARKDHLLLPQHGPLADEDEENIEDVNEVYRLYQGQLRASKALDFDDLLSETVRLFEGKPDVLHKYSNKYRHVLVDEYQDINHAQFRLLKALVRDHGNLCVVGDEDQSIYGWRGADINNILNFQRDFPGAKIVRLEQNYRSTKTILDAANAVVRLNINRLGKELWTDKAGGERIVRAELDTDIGEATFVVGEILRLHDSGTPYGNCAVLYRTNHQSRLFEEALRANRVPYQVVGSLGFYERKEIKDAIAYLRVIANSADTISLLRIINEPPRGIGEKTVERLQAAAGSSDRTLYDVMLSVGSEGILPHFATEAVAEFCKTIEHLRTRSQTSPVAELVQLALEETGYLRALEKDKSRESRARIENLRELLSAAQRFDDEQEGSLSDFLRRIALVSDTDFYEPGEGFVTLMTAHSAKGLEFPIVFAVGLEEGLFPHINSMHTAEDMEEERRLCYVVFTRARERLYATSARQRMLFGKPIRQTPSQFLLDVPIDLLRHLLGGDYEEEEAGEEEPVSAAEPIIDSGPIKLRIGDTIEHSRWGVGTVLFTRGTGKDLKVKIKFKSDGQIREFVARHLELAKAKG